LKKRRRAIAAHCRIRYDGHSRSMLLFNFHLGLAGFERKIQLRRILASEVLKHTHRGTAVILGGDYNDVWGTLGKRLLEPEGFFSASGQCRTFPAYMPMRPLDRVYVRGAIKLHHRFASRLAVARKASDHLPMIVDLEITE